MTVDRYEVWGSGPGCAVPHGIADTEFVDLLLADDEWVRREFDELVAAGWDGAVPTGPEPQQGARWPRRPGYDHRSGPAPRPAHHSRSEHARMQPRGPPRHRRQDSSVSP
jgi:hypothetical protein